MGRGFGEMGGDDRRLGGEINREIDFGFGSVVRSLGLVVRWE